jgi:hypothetical protein
VNTPQPGVIQGSQYLARGIPGPIITNQDPDIRRHIFRKLQQIPDVAANPIAGIEHRHHDVDRRMPV